MKDANVLDFEQYTPKNHARHTLIMHWVPTRNVWNHSWWKYPLFVKVLSSTSGTCARQQPISHKLTVLLVFMLCVEIWLVNDLIDHLFHQLYHHHHLIMHLLIFQLLLNVFLNDCFHLLFSYGLSIIELK